MADVDFSHLGTRYRLIGGGSLEDRSVSQHHDWTGSVKGRVMEDGEAKTNQ